MFERDDLVGVSFKGTFQRDPELAGESARFLENLKEGDGQSGLCRELSEALPKVNDAQEFGMYVFDFDPVSGFFLATGNDIFGSSGLVGTILGEMIRFRKIYAGQADTHESATRISELAYKGRIVKPDSIVNCEGEYWPIDSSEAYRGTWRLDSQPRG
jgi:hypothetical protein